MTFRTFAGVLAIAAASITAPASAPSTAQARDDAGASAAVDPRIRDAAQRLIGAALSSDHASLRLSQLCDGIGHRLSGSKEQDRAVAWGAAAMREDGLDRVWLQPVTVPHWVRGEESAVMVEPGPQKLYMLGLGGSIGTPKGGITADVVVVGSFAELESLPPAQVRGKIVLYDVPFAGYGPTVLYRRDGANRAAVRGAVAALVRSVGPVSLRTPHTGAMSDYVDSIPKIPAAAITIEDATMIHRLVSRGERVRVRLVMGARKLPDARSHNVIGEIRGSERPEEIVIVGGHLDSWDVGQGAHDDGGGCVASMEAVRLIRQLGLKPRRTLRCVLFTNEENGAKGGRAYADSADSARERHVVAVESDGGMERPVGFEVGVFRAGTDSTDSMRTTRAVENLRPIAALLSGIGSDRVTDSGGETDIDQLMRRGVPGISHRTVVEHYFDWHHTQSDMLDKVDPIELRKNVAAIAVLIYALAEMPELLVPPMTPTDTKSAAPAGTSGSGSR